MCALLASFAGRYPHTRPRRIRRYEWSRDMASEHAVTTKDLVWAVIIRDDSVEQNISAMPGILRYRPDDLLFATEKALKLGIKTLALHPALDHSSRTENGEEAHNPQGLTARTIRLLKERFPEIGIMADVALDPFTIHGHDGIYFNEDVDNHQTLEAITKQALTYADAGVDVLLPSEMMDGRIGVLRQALDAHSFTHTLILSHAAKYASSFYGPYREALGSDKCLRKGNKKTYQMDPANSNEALREVELDIAEGADMIMIKPGLPYLDIIRRVKDRFAMPTFAFHVSGEYAMLKAAALNGWLNYENCLMETLLSFKRAGTDGVLTYAALDAAECLRQQNG